MIQKCLNYNQFLMNAKKKNKKMNKVFLYLILKLQIKLAICQKQMIKT